MYGQKWQSTEKIFDLIWVWGLGLKINPNPNPTKKLKHKISELSNQGIIHSSEGDL